MVALSTAVGGSSSPSERIRLGVIGLRNQGKLLATTFARCPDAEISAICDIDPQQFGTVVKELPQSQPSVPRCEADFRRLLDDRSIDAVVVATPDHWHAWMTVLACQAGKDVYLESPATHHHGEAGSMLTAANASQRIVQVGLQQRSGLHFQTAVEAVQSGRLGTVKVARGWIVHRRKPIGVKGFTAVPEGVDYRQWLGPLSDRPFHPNRFHFNWRWFWDYGGGELAHWGVHWLDVARWGLQVDMPRRVSAVGGKHAFEDAQETPDTLSVQYDFGGSTIVWEHRLWSGHGLENRSSGVAFYGSRGTLIADRGGWKIYDTADSSTADGADLLVPHVQNFLACVKSRQTPAAGLPIGLAASTLCQLGNASYRLGREIRFSSATQSCGDDLAANELLAPESRAGWRLSDYTDRMLASATG